MVVDVHIDDDSVEFAYLWHIAFVLLSVSAKVIKSLEYKKIIAIKKSKTRNFLNFLSCFPQSVVGVVAAVLGFA